MKHALLVVSLCIIGGCYTEADVGYGYAGPAPAMVAVGPGVQVIADYDYPVFYSDGFYWRYDGGVWYRSGYYSGGWAVAYDVPVGVRRIDRPWGYAHYRAGGPVYANGGYRGAPGVYRQGGVEVRDHRAPAPVYRNAPVRGPVVRDHRR